MNVHQIEITAKGYLRIDVETASHLFPNDGLIAMFRDGQLLLFPTRGAAAGGLMLKQYNVEGDRCVLITELVRESGETASLEGKWSAVWDAEAHVLRTSLGVLS